ncbi:MAG TPA: AAA family ATPase [Thermotogota bacterium]|nr:AAA family ATPase [Thermotogota bacterium]
MKKLPIGIQDFKDIIENNYLYIDKTEYIYDMINNGKVYFLSRPRRFGKSLTISTLYYLFRGERELFKDTWIHDHWDWKERPVVKMSMSDVNTTNAATVHDSIVFHLKKIYEAYNLEISSEDLKLMFSDLLIKLSKKGKIVVLIDEYDKPILDHLHEPEQAREIRNVLRIFYSSLKDADPYLEFVLLTGITKFTKTGVFSTLNNLHDISTSYKYSQMLGYTQEELDDYFVDYMTEAEAFLDIEKEELKSEIKNFYNGFSFDGREFVYNPFSILNFFANNEFGNYWVESGSPSFLIEYVKQHEIKPNKIIGNYINKLILSTYEIETAPPVSFLLQAGYLTFKGYDRYLGYLIDYPNKEVRDSFSELLMLSEYHLSDYDSNDIRLNIFDALKRRNFEKLFLQMKRTLSNIPYTLFEPKEEFETEEDFTRKREGFYHSIILTMFWAAGVNVKAEELSNLGRSDLILTFEDDIYIIELKKQKAEKSIQQILEKGYAGKYSGNIFIAGIEIDDDKRNLGSYVFQQEKGNE